MKIGILIHFKKGTAKLEKFQTSHTLCLKGDGGQKTIRIPFSKKTLEELKKNQKDRLRKAKMQAHKAKFAM